MWISIRPVEQKYLWVCIWKRCGLFTDVTSSETRSKARISCHRKNAKSVTAIHTLCAENAEQWIQRCRQCMNFSGTFGIDSMKRWQVVFFKALLKYFFVIKFSSTLYLLFYILIYDFIPWCNFHHSKGVAGKFRWSGQEIGVAQINIIVDRK